MSQPAPGDRQAGGRVDLLQGRVQIPAFLPHGKQGQAQDDGAQPQIDKDVGGIARADARQTAPGQRAQR